MKQRITAIVFLLSLFTVFSHPLFANFGIYESYVILGSQYYDLNASTLNPDFSGADLGTFTAGGAYYLNGGEIKTFKENRDACQSNVCSGTIYWAVKQGGNPVSNGFFGLAYNSTFGDQNGLGCSTNQQWDYTAGTQNLLSGLSAGSYTLEVYCATTGSSSDNSGCAQSATESALVASFTVEAAMPVNLTAFFAQKEQSDVALYWNTAGEQNNRYFEIEHQTNGNNWEILGRLNGKGNSTEPGHYHFLHHAPAPKVHYYRLKQVDFDGSKHYSPVVSMDVKSTGSVSLSPNPLRGDQLNVNLPDAETSHEIRLYNLYGQLLKRWDVEAGSGISQALNLSGLPSGVLLLRVDDLPGTMLLRD